MTESAVSDRMAFVGRGRRLEYFTVGWNAIEGVVAVVSGVIAGSIALVGFGLDSFIEVTSGLTLLWRMSVDADVHRRELNEKRRLRIRFRPVVQDGTGTQRAGNHFGLRLVDCHAAALKGKAKGRTRPRQCCYAR